MANEFRDPLAGINTFAPEFWKLLAAGAPTNPAMAKPEGPPVPDAPVQDTRPPLTNDALEALRDAIGARADNLQDVPAPVVPPYPPFTGQAPPLTNQALRALRDAVAEWGELHDIPSPDPDFIKPLPSPEFNEQLADAVKRIGDARRNIERLEQEKAKRVPSQQGAFDSEIANLRGALSQAEKELSDQTKVINAKQKFRYGET